MKMKKLMTIFGTRPEAIKMAPLVKQIESDPRFENCVVVTAQHRQMLDQVLKAFEIVPNHDLDIMEMNPTLTGITSKVLTELGEILNLEKPDLVLVHGDTTTTFAAALAAYYHQIPIGHVEAGLRTWKKYSPFPEEGNRQLSDVLADIFFAPTQKSKNNLLEENKPGENIFVTGNTAIDAMKYTILDSYQNEIFNRAKDKKIILVTMHRRENLGSPMVNVFKTINRLVEENEDIFIVFPIHKNPKVRKLADETLIKTERIELIEPLDVIDFQNIAKRSYLIMTDSGGVQEEAPSLGVPVLVLRDTTERPEGIEAGTLKLVGTDSEKVFEVANTLINNRQKYEQMSKASNPYGDGDASTRILEAIAFFFDDSSERPQEFYY